jgi:ERCC4-type nuclease
MESDSDSDSDELGPQEPCDLETPEIFELETQAQSADSALSKDALHIIIDKRERAIIPFFQKSAELPVFVEHMTVGDIAICYRDSVLIIIERKTWPDLAASMKDGRKANIEKLKALRDITKCQIAYLIEGAAFPSPTKKFCRIPHKNLRAHLDHLAFRDSVHMLYSKSDADTAARVFEVAKNYATITPSMLVDAKLHEVGAISREVDAKLHEVGAKSRQPEQPSLLRPKHVPNDALIISNMWCACKNITNNNVNVFLNHPYKLKDLLLGAIPKKDIAVMQYTSGIMIGEKRALNIVKSARWSQTHAKMLAEIPSITIATAKKILEVISMEELLTLENAEDLLANIQKTEKTKIGKAAAKKIIKFISS